MASGQLKHSYKICGREGADWVFGCNTAFGVTRTGELFCSAGNIGPWVITNEGL
jgi:hypothetical protein